MQIVDAIKNITVAMKGSGTVADIKLQTVYST